MTGWPWPLDGVQMWFESLWNQISQWVYDAAATVWSWIPAGWRQALDMMYTLADKAGTAVIQFFQDPVSYLQAGFDWVIHRLGNTLSDIVNLFSDVAGQVWEWIPAGWKQALDMMFTLADKAGENVIKFFENPVGALQSSFNWLSSIVTDSANWILSVFVNAFNTVTAVFLQQPVFSPIDILGALRGAAEAIYNFFVTTEKSKRDAFNTRFNYLDAENTAAGASRLDIAGYITNKVQEMITTGVSGISGLVGEVLSGVIGALGGALEGFATYILTHLKWLGEMIIGAVNAVVGAIGNAVTGLFNMFIEGITGAMSGESPEPATAQASQVMVETIWNRQMELIQELYPKSPSPLTPQESATAVVGALLTTSVAAMATGAAAELAHPFKQIFAHRTVREILWMVGVPAVMASIITLPSAIGLLTPLRYALNEQFEPIIPTTADLVRMELREVFRTAERAEQLEPPPSGTFTSNMSKLGFNKWWAESFWAAHWVLPSISALNEMLHRNIIDEGTWSDFVRRNDFLPAMIPKLKEVIYKVYTRVDVRRMYDVRVLDEGEVIGSYRDLGFDDERARNMMLFTKIFVEMPDLKARYRNGWINRDELRQRMIDMGLPTIRADELMETIIRAEGAERVAPERDLTKSEIIKGVKNEIITVGQAIYLLEQLGYETWEAEYILAINKVLEAGDPESYLEMRRVTELYKKSQGKPAINITDEWLASDKAVRDKKAEIEKAQEAGETEIKLGALAVQLAQLEVQLRAKVSLKKPL